MLSRKPYLVTLIISLIFGYGMSASCQSEPIITDFSPQMLTWTNRQTNTYCDIEWVCNLKHEWIPFGANLLTTQAVTSVTSADMDQLQAMLTQFHWLLRNAPNGTSVGDFFRVVSSEQPIQPYVFTNTLRLSNVSTSVLVNVTFGLKQDGSDVPLTNLPSVLPTATTDMVDVWSQFPSPAAPIIIGSVQNGWFVSYDHNGSNRVSQYNVMPIGPIEKNVLLTVSNNSLTVDCEWVGLTQTVMY